MAGGTDGLIEIDFGIKSEEEIKKIISFIAKYEAEKLLPLFYQAKKTHQDDFYLTYATQYEIDEVVEEEEEEEEKEAQQESAENG